MSLPNKKTFSDSVVFPCSRLGWNVVLQDKRATLYSPLWAPEEFLLYLMDNISSASSSSSSSLTLMFTGLFLLPISPLCHSAFCPFLNMLSLMHHNFGSRAQLCPVVGPLEPYGIIWNQLITPAAPLCQDWDTCKQYST